MPCSLVNHPLWTSLLWLRHRQLTHRYVHFNPHWPIQAAHSTVTRPQAHNALSSHRHSDALESVQPRSLSQPGLYGLVSMPMFAEGLARVYSARIQRHTTAPLSPFTTADARFDVIHIDPVGPLPPPRGFTYLLTCVDLFTRWPEAIPLTNITAEAVAQAFLNGLIARFGVPSTIVTDRGRQFESRLWNTLMTLLGSKHARATAYHLPPPNQQHG